MELSTSRPPFSRSANGGRARAAPAFPKRAGANHLAQGAQDSDPDLLRIRQARRRVRPGDPEEGRGSSAQRKSLPQVLASFPGRHESQGSPRLYRENFTPEECQELDRNESLSAVSELCVLRILLARVLRALRKLKPTLEHHYKNLVIFSQVGATMASLARFQYSRQGPAPSLLDLIYPEEAAIELFASNGWAYPP